MPALKSRLMTSGGEGIMAHISIKFDVEIQIVERSECLFVATIMPFHVTGYSDTFDGSIDRAKRGLAHLLEAYRTDGNLFRFLDESKVEYATEREGTSWHMSLSKAEGQTEKENDDTVADLVRFLNERSAGDTTERDTATGNSSEQWVTKQVAYAGAH